MPEKPYLTPRGVQPEMMIIEMWLPGSTLRMNCLKKAEQSWALLRQYKTDLIKLHPHQRQSLVRGSGKHGRCWIQVAQLAHEQ